MSTRLWQVLVGAALLSLTAFYVGFQDGKKKMDEFCGVAIQATSAGAHSSALKFHRLAIKALEGGDAAEAARLLRILEHTDEQPITECEIDPTCKTFPGKRVDNSPIPQGAK
jgi:hypothetical protein